MWREFGTQITQSYLFAPMHQSLQNYRLTNEAIIVKKGINYYVVLPRLQKKKPVDFDDELKIVDVRYDNMT